LRREIVATSLVNQMIDRSGLTYAFVLGELTGATPADALRAFLIVSAVFDLPDLWARTDELSGPCRRTLVDGIIARPTGSRPGSAVAVDPSPPTALTVRGGRAVRSAVRAMRLRLPELLAGREARGSQEAGRRSRRAGGADAAGAAHGGLQPGIGLFDAIEVAERVPGVPLEDIVRMYFTLADRVR
jgi:glutamate dehydrogenase